MSARILVLPFERLRSATARLAQYLPADAADAVPAQHIDAAALREAAERLQLWPGASGRIYPFTAYGLLECPPLPNAAYLLIGEGRPHDRPVLAVGSLTQSAPTLNLAQLRRHGATLGARQVHIHLPAGPAEAAAAVARDVAGAVEARASAPHRQRATG